MKPTPQVLLIDRHSNDVKVVRDVLGSAGLEIHVRTSASAALVAFHALEPDLVLVDSDVPGTSGAAVTREIKNTERGRETPVILMADGPIEESLRAKTLDSSGCSMLLQKPLMPQDLLDTLSRFLPGAFIGGKPPATDAPKGSAPRRAAGVMRDPGTPFTADSFDEDSLGALLDQVFPTSDSGQLGRAIRRRPPQTGAEAAPDAALTSAAPPEAPASATSAAHQVPATSSQAAKAPSAPVAPPRLAQDVSMPSSSSVETDPSASDLVADYLAHDDSPGEDELPTGLSMKDDAVLDRVFDGAWSRPTVADDREIEPLEADRSEGQSPTPVPAATGSEVIPKAIEAPEDLPAPAFASAGEASMGDLDLGDDEPPTSAWQEIDAALPPAQAPSATTSAAPSRASGPSTRFETSPPTQAPAPAPTPMKDSAPLTTAAKRESTPPPPDVVMSAPAPSPAGPPETVHAVAPPAPAETPAAPEIPTIPLAHDTSADAQRETRASESRRSKKAKKGRDSRHDKPEKAIPLAVMEPEATMSSSLQAQSVAESLTSHAESAAVPPETFGEDSRVAIDADVYGATAKPRRTGLVVIVGAGLALAAAVALFFVWNRSGDSDLRPTAPGRSRASVAESSIPSPPEAESPAANEDLHTEALPPVIPNPEDEGAGGKAATDSATPGDASGQTGKAAVPVQTPSNAGKTASPAVTGPDPAARTASHAPVTDASPAHAGSAPAAAAARAPERALERAPKVASAQNPAPPTPVPAAERTNAPTANNGPPANPPAAAANDAPKPAEREASLPAPPAASGTAQPVTEIPPSPTGQVALGATLPPHGDESGTAPETENEMVSPLISPVPLSRHAPVYPPSALAMKSTGTVGILVKVEADGTVSDVKVVRSASPTLNAAAVAAARHWTYRPAHRGAESVATWIEETVVFRLKR